MKKAVLFGITAVALGLVVASIGVQDVKPTTTKNGQKKSYKDFYDYL